ncbi:MAG: hypothetical protein JJU21_00915 [Salinarimonas sp.]|nr:hypothetical protein [Salinarimonas sp.]
MCNRRKRARRQLRNLHPQRIHLPDNSIQPPDRNIGDGAQGATIGIGHGEEGEVEGVEDGAIR